MPDSILIVDDDPLARTALAVEVDEQFQVFEASGTDEALSLLAKTAGICAVVSAREMSGGTGGQDLLRQVQERSPGCVRVLASRRVLSGEEVHQLVECGVAHRWVPKPWRPGEVLEAIRDALPVARSQAPTPSPGAPPPSTPAPFPTKSALVGAPYCRLCLFHHAEAEPCPVVVSVEEESVSETITPVAVASAASAPAAMLTPRLPIPLVETDPLLGAIAGSFRLARQLGRGGMGTVYLGEHPIIGSKVAIKFLHESLASDPELVARFYAEARAVNLIGHENIVNIFDLNYLPPSRYFIVMEYLDGKRLSSLLKEGAVEPTAALLILIQLCDALHAAHKQDVVHRDLKPDNVFLISRKGNPHFVKLLDFGIAKLRDASAKPSKTAAGMILGTPEYMAPEQCDARPVDARTDIYALGVINYQLATGALPFNAPSVPGFLLAHLNQTPTPPSQVNPRVHPEWERAILKALAKNPDDRFETMAEFGEALTAALEAAPSAAKLVAAANRTLAAAATPHPVHSRHVADFEVEVLTDGQASGQRLQANDISRGGMYLATDGALPDTFSRVRIRVGSPPAPRSLELVGEVVRHVTPKEGQAWNMSPGFAVQFVDLSSELRTAIGQIIANLPQLVPGPAPAQPADDPVAARLLLNFQKRVAGGHYEFLAMPPDASSAEIQNRCRTLRDDVSELRGRPLSATQATQVEAALERIEQAAATLGSPYQRIEYDAQRGNYLGVTQCMMAGVVNSYIDELRAVVVDARPDVGARTQEHLDRAHAAVQRGDAPSAVSEYEAALAADPLNLELHQGYWALKRDFRKPH